MSLTFKAEGHIYKSIDDLDSQIDWLGVTTFVSHFKEPFHAEVQAIKSSFNKKSKWYGLTPEKIQEIWNSEGERASSMGTWYHDQRESDILDFDTIVREGVTVPIIRPIYKDDIKYAPDQKLVNGVYPEHFIYLKSAGICGQSDRVEVVNDIVSVSDYKTNKELKTKGFTNWEGITKMMYHPLEHLEDCHLTHYSLQLSLYLYMILKHNPKLKPGKLVLDHISFEEEGRDNYDYPIYKKDDQGNFIVKEVKQYILPYLRTEVNQMIEYLKENRNLIKTKK